MSDICVGSLFSGIGGLDYGFEKEGFRIAWQVENNPYCQQILRQHFPTTKIYADIRDCAWESVEGVDVLIGGFPCQPHSVAGKKKGSDDERDMWPEFYRSLRSLRPKWVVAENVPGLLSSNNGRFFKGILGDLAEARYDAEWFTLSASDIGAIHKRERLFIVAHSLDVEHRPPRGGIVQEAGGVPQENRPQDGSSRQSDGAAAGERDERPSGDTSNADSNKGRPYQEPSPKDAAADNRGAERPFITDDWSDRIQRFKQETLSGKSGLAQFADVRTVEELLQRSDIPQPLIRRGSDGVPRGMDTHSRAERTKAVGNAVVPQVAQFIARRLKELNV